MFSNKCLFDLFLLSYLGLPHMTPQAHPDDLLAHQQMSGLAHPQLAPGHLGLPPQYGLDQQHMLGQHMPGNEFQFHEINHNPERNGII